MIKIVIVKIVGGAVAAKKFVVVADRLFVMPAINARAWVMMLTAQERMKQAHERKSKAG